MSQDTPAARPKGQHPQVKQLRYGIGMPPRRLISAVLVVLSVVGPVVAYAALTAVIMKLVKGNAPLATHHDVTLGGITGSSTDLIRAFAFFGVYTIIWLCAYALRPVTWLKIVMWNGILMSVELLLTGAFGLLFVSNKMLYENPIANALYIPAAIVPMCLAWLCARGAVRVMSWPHTSELTRSATEVPLRLAGTEHWLRIQHDRIGKSVATKRWRLPRPPHVAMTWEDFRYVQIGRTHQAGHFRLPDGSNVTLPAGKLLRVVGDVQQWVLPVGIDDADTYLALIVGRAEHALEKSQPGADRHGDLQARSQNAAKDIASEKNSMRGGGRIGFRSPRFLPLVAVACLTMSFVSFFPRVVAMVYTLSNPQVNVGGGTVFGLVGLASAWIWFKGRRGARYMDTHPLPLTATEWGDMDPTKPPANKESHGVQVAVPDWQALTPAIYPRNVTDTDVGGVRYTTKEQLQSQ